MGALDRIGLGYQTQWKGLDKQGKPRGALYTDWNAPKEEWQFNSEAQQYLPPTKTVRPGMVDDLLALPDVVTLGHGPEFSKRASDRTQQLDEGLRQDMGIGPPESWMDYLAEAGGTMLAQLPTPGGESASMKSLPKFLGPLSRMIQRIPKPIRKVAGGIPEWFMPTIQPTPSNLAVGTVAGAAMTKFLPEIAARMSSNPDDIWDIAYRAAQDYQNSSPEERKHMLSPDMLMQIANHMDPQEEEPSENFQGESEFLDELLKQPDNIESPEEETTAMAKGGKVTRFPRVRRMLILSPAERAALRASLSDFNRTYFNSPNALTLGKETDEGIELLLDKNRAAEIDAVLEDVLGLSSRSPEEGAQLDRQIESLPEGGIDELRNYFDEMGSSADSREEAIREAIQTYSQVPVEHLRNRTVSQALDLDEFGTVAEYLHSLGFSDIGPQLQPHIDRLRELEASGGPGYEEEAAKAFSLIQNVLKPHVVKKAKGGRIKPPTDVHPRMKLRQRLEDLMKDAAVEGTGKEMVPVDPSASVPATTPTLEDLKSSIEQPTAPTSFEGPTVSRRDVLSGIASSLSPIKLDPMALLGGDSDLEAGLDAARKAVDIGKTLKPASMSKAALAKLLTEVYQTAVHSSEEDAILGAADLADAIPGAGEAGIGSTLRQWHEFLTTDPEAGNLDSELPEKWHQNVLGRMMEFARQNGLIARPGQEVHYPDVENGPEFDTISYDDPTFTEPIAGGKALLDGMIEMADRAESPSADKLRKLRDYLGDRADAALTESYMTEEPSPLMDEALRHAGFDPYRADVWDNIHDELDEYYMQYGHLDDWIRADPVLREEFTDIENQLRGTPTESPEGQKLLERKMQIEKEIWPGYRGNYPDVWPEE